MKFNKRIQEPTKEIFLKLLEIDNLSKQWVEGAKLSPQVLGRLKKSTLITSSGASTRIEGAELSDEDVEKLMQGLTVQKFKERDKQEVKGYYELLNNVFNSWKNLTFSENQIKHFHKELLKYVEKDQKHRGDYKKSPNTVEAINEAGIVVAKIFETTPPYLAPKETQELVDWTKQALKDKEHHPLLIIGNFIVDFLKIHPFQDGNGRLSRILTNFLLLKAGYLYMPYMSHEKIVEDNKGDYYVALRRSQKTFKTKNDNIIEWLNFFLRIIAFQSRLAVELLSDENIEKLLSKNQLAVWQYLEKAKEAAPKEISDNLKIPLPTVKQTLNKLIEFKKIKRVGLGRATRYKAL